MLYVKANNKASTTTWLARLWAISTAPAPTYPLSEEQLILPSDQTPQLSPSASPLTTSITVLSLSRALAVSTPKI